MTWLLKIIHTPCCEQFHGGASFLSSKLHQLAVSLGRKLKNVDALEEKVQQMRGKKTNTRPSRVEQEQNNLNDVLKPLFRAWLLTEQ